MLYPTVARSSFGGELRTPPCGGAGRVLRSAGWKAFVTAEVCEPTLTSRPAGLLTQRLTESPRSPVGWTPLISPLGKGARGAEE